MKRILVSLFSLLLLGAAGDRWPDSSVGGIPDIVNTSSFAGGSETCGIQEVYERASTLSRATVAQLPGRSCTITEPIQIDETTGFTIAGINTGQISVTNSGSRLVADFDAIELEGLNDTITIDSDFINSGTTDYNGISTSEVGVAALQGKLILESAGANTIGWTTIVGNEFEVGQCIRLEQFNGGGTSDNDDDGGPYCILEIQTTTNTDDTLLVTDPKNRLTATVSGIGGDNESVHGTTITATAGLTDWGAIEPLNGVPFFVRFKVAGSDGCPFGASCGDNGRAWQVIQQVSATEITVDDPSVFAVSQAGIVVDWVASPPMIFVGETYFGPDLGGQPRNITFRDFSLFGDGDGDGDGDAFAAIVHQPDADHASTFSLFRRDNINMTHFGNGDATFSGTDFTYLDTAVWLQGVQHNTSFDTATNDQDDQLLVTHEQTWDVGRCYFMNSVQSVLMDYYDLGCTDASYIAYELESGQVSIYEWSSSIDDQTDDLDHLFYIHDTALEFRIHGGRTESGAGTILTAEAAFAGNVRIEQLEMFTQAQDREDLINFQGTGVLTLLNNTIHRNNAAYEVDIEAPNAFKVNEFGTACRDENGAAVTCADGPTNVIENRNYPGGAIEPRAGSGNWYANDAATADANEFMHREPTQASSGLATPPTNEQSHFQIATFAAGQVASPTAFSCAVNNGTGTGTLNLNLGVIEDGNDNTIEIIGTIGFNLATEFETIKQDTSFAAITSTAPYYFVVQLTDGGSLAITATADLSCHAEWIHFF